MSEIVLLSIVLVAITGFIIILLLINESWYKALCEQNEDWYRAMIELNESWSYFYKELLNSKDVSLKEKGE